MERSCRKCLASFPLTTNYFHRRSDGRNGGYFSHCKVCENQRNREKYIRLIDSERLRQRAKNQRNKATTISAYGGKCACCNESELAFLSIDHINGDGGWHRRNKTQGPNLYVWLRHQHYPDGFQVLCYNCNWAKSRAGGCPHRHNNKRKVTNNGD